MEAKSLFEINMEGSITLTMTGKGFDATKIARIFPVGKKVTVRFGDDGDVIQVMLVSTVNIESDPEGEEDHESVHASIQLESEKKKRPHKKRGRRRERRECENCCDDAEPGSDYCSDCDPG